MRTSFLAFFTALDPFPFIEGRFAAACLEGASSSEEESSEESTTFLISSSELLESLLELIIV